MLRVVRKSEFASGGDLGAVWTDSRALQHIRAAITYSINEPRIRRNAVNFCKIDGCVIVLGWNGKNHVFICPPR
jgi:hypothetical protein